MTAQEPGSGAASPPEPAHLSPQAGLELAQELALVSSALFTQLLPGSADHALSGVPGMGQRGASPTSPTPAPPPTSPPTSPPAPVAPSPVLMATMEEPVPEGEPAPVSPVQAPVTVPLSVPVPPEPAEVQIPLSPAGSTAPPRSGSASLPLIEAIEAIEVLEVIEVLEAPDDVPVVEPTSLVPRPPQSDRRSQDMLTEIGFLDDEGDGVDDLEPVRVEEQRNDG